MKAIIIAVIAVFCLASAANAAIYLGICDGYVKDTLGVPVQGATVNITVQNCAVDCLQTTFSDSSGYYISTNLNLPANGTVTVTANKSTSYGEATGQADEFQAASVNVTLCLAPSAPVLQNVADSHNPSAFTLNWTSVGATDDFYFDGTTYINASHPQYRYNLDFKTYTWGARSCNPSCCSQWVYDSFSVYNNPPPAPTLVHVPNTRNNTINFSWSSVTDPDGDALYYEFKLDGIVDSNVSSPVTKTGITLASHNWGVRVCDPWLCSAWSLDSFSAINNAPSQPNLTNQTNTNAGSVALQWTSGADSENDTTHDEYQFDSNAAISPAASPQVEAVSGIALHTWRVRTCDNYSACSAWVNGSFIRYESVTVAKPTPCVCGGASITLPNATVACKEKWICEDWSSCDPKTETQTRECVDIKNCNATCSKPETLRTCQYKPTCSDGIQNQDETGVDCGGPCTPCIEIPMPTPSPSYYVMFSLAALAVSVWIVLNFIVPHVTRSLHLRVRRRK